MSRIENVKCVFCGAVEATLHVGLVGLREPVGNRFFCYVYCNCRDGAWNSVWPERRDQQWMDQARTVIDWNDLSVLRFRLFLEACEEDIINV